jgi:hypothetical protein
MDGRGGVRRSERHNAQVDFPLRRKYIYRYLKVRMLILTPDIELQLIWAWNFKGGNIMFGLSCRLVEKAEVDKLRQYHDSYSAQHIPY